MDYTSNVNGNCMELAMSGQFLFTDNELCREIVNKMNEHQGNEVVFDINQLEFIDSAGLGMLLLAKETADKKQQQVRLRGLKGQVKHMIEVSKFDALIPCEH